MTTIYSTENQTWGRAKKTAPILVRPMTEVVSADCADFMLIDTLEGPQKPVMTNVLCRGMAVGEPWQQKPEALNKKYTHDGTMQDGWAVYTPRPENEVEFFQLRCVDGYIVGQWGSEVEGVGKNLQAFVAGDYVCRQTYDHSDQWVVRQGLFNATYNVIQQPSYGCSWLSS